MYSDGILWYFSCVIAWHGLYLTTFNSGVSRYVDRHEEVSNHLVELKLVNLEKVEENLSEPFFSLPLKVNIRFKHSFLQWNVDIKRNWIFNFQLVVQSLLLKLQQLRLY